VLQAISTRQHTHTDVCKPPTYKPDSTVHHRLPSHSLAWPVSCYATGFATGLQPTE